MIQKLEQTIEAAKKFIEEGGKCIYRYGWAWKGAGANYKTKEWALSQLAKNWWGFGKGFYILSWIERDGETVLEFNELGENDMW